MPGKTPYEQLKEENHKLENQFRIYGGLEEKNGIEILEPSEPLWGGELQPQTARKTKWVKHRLKTSNRKTSYTLDLVNKDGAYQTTIWTTTPENIKKALNAGIFDPQEIPNPLAKMIAQIGQYQRYLHEQVVIEKELPPDYAKKMTIADIAQKSLGALHGLHACINNYKEGLSPRSNLKIIIIKVYELSKEIDDLSKEVEKLISEDKPEPGTPPTEEELESYKALKEGLEELQTETNRYFEMLNSLQPENTKEKDEAKQETREVSREDLVSYVQRPYGETDLAIQHFLQKQINCISKFAAGANNRLGPSLLGTDPLGRHLLKARAIGEKFSNTKIDYHNPVTLSHAYDFTGMESKDGLVSLDLAKFGFKPQTELDLLKGLDQLRVIEEGSSLKGRVDKEKQKKSFGGRMGEQLKRLGGWFGRLLENSAKDLVGLVADFIALVGYSVLNFFNWVLNNPLTKIDYPSSRRRLGFLSLRKREKGEAAYLDSALHGLPKLVEQIQEKTNLAPRATLEKALTTLARLIDVFVLDLGRALLQGGRTITKLVSDIRHDLGLGQRRPLQDKELIALLKSCEREERRIRTDYAQKKTEFFIASAYEQKPIAEVKDIASATVPYLLTPDDPSDLFSWATNHVFKGFTESISQDMYRDRPLPGFAFTMGAAFLPLLATGLGPAFMTQATSFIHDKVTVPLAHTFVSSNTTDILPVITADLVQGAFAFLAVDAFSGEESFLGRRLKSTADNPVLAYAIMASAIGLGYLMTHQMQLAGLSTSQSNATKMATVPYVALGTVTTELAYLLIENAVMLKQKPATEVTELKVEALLKDHETEIRQALELELRMECERNSVNLTAEQKKKIIDKDYEKYCHEFTNHYYVKNYLAEQAQKLTAAEEKWQASSESQAWMKKEEIIRRISQLNPAVMTKEQIRQVLDYVRVNFQDDQPYIRALKERLEPKKERGWVYNSLSILFTDLLNGLIRLPLAWWQRRHFNKKAETPRSPAKAAEARQLASLADQRMTEYLDQAKSDFGLLVKGTMSLLRGAWEIAASPFYNFADVSLSKVPLKQFGEMRTLLANWFFSPGAVSRGMDSLVGWFRAVAGTKRFKLAERDALVRGHAKNRAKALVAASPSASKAADSKATPPAGLPKASSSTALTHKRMKDASHAGPRRHSHSATSSGPSAGATGSKSGSSGEVVTLLLDTPPASPRASSSHSPSHRKR